MSRTPGPAAALTAPTTTHGGKRHGAGAKPHHPSGPMPTVSLRIPAETIAAARSRATTEHTSLSAWVTRTLARALARSRSRPVDPARRTPNH